MEIGGSGMGREAEGAGGLFVEDGVPCLTQRTLAPMGAWHLLLGCVMLNQTHRRQARPAVEAILAAAAGPEEFAAAPDGPIAAALLPCGLATRRLAVLRAMTEAHLAGEHVLKLPGLGPYAWDSYDIFALGALLGPEDVGDLSLRPFLIGAHAGRWAAPPRMPYARRGSGRPG